MRVLIAENSKTMSSLIMFHLSQIKGIELEYVSSMDKLVTLIQEKGFEYYDLAVSGIHLSGCDMGQSIAFLTEHQIPTIVFSGEYSEDNRNRFITMPGVVDYVIKENQRAMRYLKHMVQRFLSNRSIKVLVVTQDQAEQLHISGLLRKYAFQVLNTQTGEEAIEILEDNRDIKMVVTSQDIGSITGLDLTNKIRQTYDREDMAIIGISTQETHTLPARFIKYGANDFIIMPFQPEEFLCRMTLNIDMIENSKVMFDLANKDYLTGLFNRRFFFETAQGKLRRAHREGANVAVAILDIDHFKSVNDTFGHDVGDEVLKGVSELLKDLTRPSDILARLGGEEFCVFIDGMSDDEVYSYFEKLRQKIESRHFESLGDRGHVTSSFGVVFCNDKRDLDAMMKAADGLLYKSKQTGRNKVTMKSLDLLEAS